MSMPVVFEKHRVIAGINTGKVVFVGSLVILCLAWEGFSSVVQAQINVGELSADVHAVIDKKIEALRNELTQDPRVVETVLRYNEANKDLSAEEIQTIDKTWRNTPGFNDFMKEILLNPCSKRLTDFQEKYDGFAEIFVTDVRGLNVGMTNKTTDYYQADEDWWVRAFAGDQGHFYRGEIEYDQSAMSEAIPVYVPVIDPQTRKAIGVIKAVVDLVTIRMEL